VRECHVRLLSLGIIITKISHCLYWRIASRLTDLVSWTSRLRARRASQNASRFLAHTTSPIITNHVRECYLVDCHSAFLITCFQRFTPTMLSRYRGEAYLVLAVCFIALVLVAFKIQILAPPGCSTRLKKSSSNNVSKSDRYPQHLQYMDLYEAVYEKRNTSSLLNHQVEDGDMTYNHQLRSDTYGDAVTQCNLTVVFVDPRLPNLGPSSPAWFTLESVGAFAPDACVLIQTGMVLCASMFFKLLVFRCRDKREYISPLQ
jgi:hypothetical protein